VAQRWDSVHRLLGPIRNLYERRIKTWRCEVESKSGVKLPRPHYPHAVPSVGWCFLGWVRWPHKNQLRQLRCATGSSINGVSWSRIARICTKSRISRSRSRISFSAFMATSGVNSLISAVTEISRSCRRSLLPVRRKTFVWWAFNRARVCVAPSLVEVA